MSNLNRPRLTVYLKEEENYCAKCCKTRQVVERMLDTFPDLKDKIRVYYKTVSEEDIGEYGEYSLPLIKINDDIFSKGHVPVIKKLSRELKHLIA